MVRTLTTRQAPTSAAPVPLRSRTERNALGTGARTSALVPSKGRDLSRVPSHADLGDYLPPYAHTDRSPAEVRDYLSPMRGMRTARLAAIAGSFSRRSRSKSPIQLHDSAPRPQDARKASVPTEAARGTSPGRVESGRKSVGAQEEQGGWETPAPKARPQEAPDSAAMSTGGRSLAASLRSNRARSPMASPRSPRNKGVTHMWDVVKYVSGVYSEVYKQI